MDIQKQSTIDSDKLNVNQKKEIFRFGKSISFNHWCDILV